MSLSITSKSQHPSVSVVIPAFNEEHHIRNVVAGFINTRYPNLLEVIVVDGKSTDSTRAIVSEMAKLEPRIRIIDNPKRYQSWALNLALAAARGDIFLRADAHCIYADDYIEQCVEALLTSGALNVGGAQRFVAASLFQLAVAVAVRGALGSGGARYRSHEFSGHADTVFLGCFWRTALAEAGGYDGSAITNEDYAVNLRLRGKAFSEANVTNQDAELNKRLLERSTRAIYISSKIRVWYFPRETLRRLAVQYFKYGRGRCITSCKHRQLFCRGAVPALGVICIVMIGLLSLLLSSWLLLMIYVAVGIALIGGQAGLLLIRNRNAIRREIWRGQSSAPSLSMVFGCVCLALVTMPILHGSGFLYQLVKMGRSRRIAW